MINQVKSVLNSSWFSKPIFNNAFMKNLLRYRINQFSKENPLEYNSLKESNAIKIQDNDCYSEYTIKIEVYPMVSIELDVHNDNPCNVSVNFPKAFKSMYTLDDKSGILSLTYYQSYSYWVNDCTIVQTVNCGFSILHNIIGIKFRNDEYSMRTIIPLGNFSEFCYVQCPRITIF